MRLLVQHNLILDSGPNFRWQDNTDMPWFSTLAEQGYLMLFSLRSFLGIRPD